MDPTAQVQPSSPNDSYSNSPFPNQPPKKQVFLYVLLGFIALGLFVNAFIYWNFKTKNKQTNNVSQTTTKPVVSSSPQQANSTGTFYFSQNEEKMFSLYKGNQNGNIEKIIEVPIKTSSDIYATSYSPDKTSFAYVRQKNTIILVDLQTKKEKSFSVNIPADEQIFTLSFTPSGDEILFVNSTQVSSSPNNTVQVLSLTSGKTQVVGSIQGLLGFRFAANKAAKKIYILTKAQCAPGPCYDGFYTYDVTGKKITKGINPDAVFGHQNSYFVDDSSTVLLTNNETDVMVNKPIIGKIEKYDITTGKKTTVLEVNDRVLTNAHSISNDEILYESLVKSTNGNNSQLFIYNLATNTSKKIYEGNRFYDIVPITDQYAVFTKYTFANGKTDLGILNFSDGTQKIIHSGTSFFTVSK